MFLEGGYELSGSLFSYPRNSRDVERKIFEGFNVDTEGTFACGDTQLCSQDAGRQRPENLEFEASLGQMVQPCLRI